MPHLPDIDVSATLGNKYLFLSFTCKAAWDKRLWGRDTTYTG